MLLYLRAELPHASIDIRLLPRAIDNRRCVLVDGDALSTAKHVQRDVFELDAEFFTDDGTARQDGDILKHVLAAITKAGGFDGRAFKPPRSLLTISVARASPSTSSAMIRSGLAIAQPLRAAVAGAEGPRFSFADQDQRLVQVDYISSGSVTK